MWRRARWLRIGWLIAVAGCDHVVVQHDAVLSETPGDAGDVAADAGTVPEGGTVAEANACVGTDDGTACDDLDVCTPSSRCEGGQCVGGSAFDSCVVADALEEYQLQQGDEGWYYGYWNATQDADGSYDHETDFMEMEHCEPSMWRPVGRCDDVQGSSGFQWTRVLDWALMHPETRPDTELPIRRWVSDVSGPAVVTVEHNVGGDAGDGTRAILLLDGEELWRHDAPPGEDTPFTEELEIDLREGSIVDQLVHPIGTSADDTTYFNVSIRGR
ncbi:MAG: hypothetical protein OXT09_30510 [Myxococcales bacterium]|nr:hypothetical protein [Myxococcales bacterium]